jgi:hypothetical protein
MPMTWKTYFNMHYFCALWYYNSCMSSPPRYSYSDCIIYRELVINESSTMHNDCFDQKNWSTHRNKCQVVKQVYRVKR